MSLFREKLGFGHGEFVECFDEYHCNYQVPRTANYKVAKHQNNSLIEVKVNDIDEIALYIANELKFNSDLQTRDKCIQKFTSDVEGKIVSLQEKLAEKELKPAVVRVLQRKLVATVKEKERITADISNRFKGS